MLHVEDEEDHAKFLEIFLHENDVVLHVDSASSAEEALKKLKEKQYDCIVSDYMMPKVNGIQFVEQVKKRHDIPFIIYTGQGSEEVAQAAFTAGVDDYVRKEMDPSHYRVLAKSIRQAVEKKRAENELKESLQTSSHVLRQLPSGVFIYRFVAPDKLVLVNCNPEAMRQTSMDRDKVVGKEFDELWGPTGAPLKHEYLKAVKENKQVKYDRLLWDSPNIKGYFRLSAFPIVGDRLVVAFENISEQVRSEEKLERLYESAVKIGEATTIEGLEKASQHAVLEVAGFDRGCIGLIEGDELVFRPIDMEGAEFRFPLNGGSTQVKSVNEGKAILIPDTLDDQDYVHALPPEVFKPRSVFMVPFRLEGKVEGVLHVADSGPSAFNDNDRRLLETLSLYIETAYSRIRKRQLEETYNRRLEVLYRHAVELETARSLDELYKLTLRLTDEILGFNNVDILVVHGNRLEQTFYRGDIYEGIVVPLDGRGVTVRAVKQRRTQLVNDVSSDPDYVSPRMLGSCSSHEADYGSELATPILVRDEAHGVINVLNRSKEAFNEQDAKLMETLASQVSMAITRFMDLEEIRSSEDRYRLLLEQCMDGVFIIAEKEYVYANVKAAEMLGYGSPEEIVGRDSVFAVADEDKERLRNQIRDRLSGGDAPTRYEARLVKKTGEKLEVEASTTVIPWRGQPASLVFMRDISDRKRIERALKESEEWFRKIYQESPIGIEIYNGEGTIIDANPTSLHYFGVNGVEDFHGWNLFRDSSLSQEQKDRLRSGEEIRVEARRDFTQVKYTSRRRGVSYFEAIFKPVSKGKEDSGTGYIGLVRDVTEVRLSQERFREYTERLEKAVEERSNELLEAERMATAGRVASMVGHDLRSPLQSVKNAVYMIKQKPELTPRMLGLIEGAVDRSLRMLDELRQRTREEPLSLAPTNLRRLVEDTAREMPHPPKVSIKVEAEDVATVSVDPLKVRRVLENLINNAVESIKTEGTVSVTLRNVGDGLEVKVADNGRGMPSDAMVNLFKPFYTTKPGGMGMGLAFCKKTVEAHGGSIDVESKEGKGTTVTFTIPLGREDAT